MSNTPKLTLSAKVVGLGCRIWDTSINALCRNLCLWFPSRCRTVPHAEDPSKPLLTQLLLWHQGKTSVYLQHFETAEDYDWFHRHRWTYMRSYVLSGMYLEERPVDPNAFSIPAKAETVIRCRYRLTTHTFEPETIHRVDFWSPKCWTVFVTKNPDQEWGYYPRGKFGAADFVPWRQFIKQRIPSLESGQVTK
jgi:hypothetical protein